MRAAALAAKSEVERGAFADSAFSMDAAQAPLYDTRHQGEANPNARGRRRQAPQPARSMNDCRSDSSSPFP